MPRREGGGSDLRLPAELLCGLGEPGAQAAMTKAMEFRVSAALCTDIDAPAVDDQRRVIVCADSVTRNLAGKTLVGV